MHKTQFNSSDQLKIAGEASVSSIAFNTQHGGLGQILTMKHYAHSKINASELEWQTLEQHSIAVATIADEFASVFCAGKWGFATGMLHDLGKFRFSFQRMLRKEIEKCKDTNHAIYGAVVASQRALPVAFAIAGHHAGLHDLSDLQAAMEKLPADDDCSSALNSDFLSGLSLPNESDLPAGISRACQASEAVSTLVIEYFTRMIFSCLIDADRLDSAFWEELGRGTVSLAKSTEYLNPNFLLERVVAERERKSNANLGSPMADTRNTIFDACLTGGEAAQGFFSLTVPTGGGKTLSAMAFALAHAKRYGLQRVIVVIPYLSIIEQNAAEYHRILDPENKGIVIECHSSVKLRDNATDEEVSRIELVSENWDAPVVVTTSVQFIESLFAASPSRARKLHNIAKSVVIFDEVQTLPTHLLAPTLSVFRELARNYGVSFVFSSATQPAFRHSSSLKDGFTPSEIREIAPAPNQLFANLRRVSYHFPSPDETLDWDALADRLVLVPQCLCVVNLTRHARELWDRLNHKIGEINKKLRDKGERQEKPIHLSSAMCPAHRLTVIRYIRRNLKLKRPCRVISTQLIEAGVDVDFPEVWRAMGPLDSIVQVAGRCNREGKLVDDRGQLCFGNVHVFIPAENKLPVGVYTTATSQATVTLAGLGEHAAERLATDPEIFSSYFSALFSLVATDHVTKGENTIQYDREKLHFRTVADKAVVIKDSGTPVIIPIGYARRYIKMLRTRNPVSGEPRFMRDDLRRLQRYMVNIKNDDFMFFANRKLLTPLLPNLEFFVLDACQYNRHLGTLKPDDAPPLEDFFG